MFRPRINRQRFLFSYILVGLVGYAYLLPLCFVTECHNGGLLPSMLFFNVTQPSLFLLSLPVSFLSCWLEMQRLQDIGYRGDVAIILYFVSLLLGGLLHYIISFADPNIVSARFWVLAIFLLFSLCRMAYVLKLHLWPGMKGENQFGPNPLDPDDEIHDVYYFLSWWLGKPILLLKFIVSLLSDTILLLEKANTRLGRATKRLAITISDDEVKELLKEAGEDLFLGSSIRNRTATLKAMAQEMEQEGKWYEDASTDDEDWLPGCDD